MTEGDRCPTCGRPTRPASLFLDPLPPPPEHHHEEEPGADAVPPDPDSDPDSDPVPGRRRPGRRRLVGLVAFAGLVLLGAGVASLAAGDDGDDDTAGGDVRPRSSTPTTSLGRTATTGRPVVTSTATTAILGQLLPERTGVSLLVSSAGGRVFRIDLDTGRVERVEASRTGWRDTWTAISVGDRILVARPNGVLVLSSTELSVEADIGPGDAFHTGGRRVWMTHYRRDTPVVREVVFERDSFAVGPEVDLPQGAGVIGATAAGLVLEYGNQTFLFDPDTGAARSLARGRVVATAPDRVAVMVCSETLVCPVEVQRLDGAVIATVDVPAGANFVPWPGGVFSPDGRRLILAAHRGGDRPGLLYVDLEDGHTVEHADVHWQGQPSVAWAGDWAFVPTDSGLFAVGPTGRRLVPLADGLLGPVQWVVPVP